MLNQFNDTTKSVETYIFSMQNPKTGRSKRRSGCDTVVQELQIDPEGHSRKPVPFKSIVPALLEFLSNSFLSVAYRSYERIFVSVCFVYRGYGLVVNTVCQRDLKVQQIFTCR